MTENSKADEIGEIVFAAVSDTCVLESESWAIERIDRVNRLVQHARPGGKPFEVHVPWIDNPTAFTAPGRHIYVSRSLFQMIRTDDQLAFILAHEMSHHDLGHVEVFPDWLSQVLPSDASALVLALYRVVETRIYGSRTECEADLHALKLCEAAGYDPSECISVFDILMKVYLDMGDVVTVFGVADPEDDSWSANITRWLAERSSGYLSVQKRRDILASVLAET